VFFQSYGVGYFKGVTVAEDKTRIKVIRNEAKEAFFSSLIVSAAGNVFLLMAIN
jgi:hypothetical protein